MFFVFVFSVFLFHVPTIDLIDSINILIELIMGFSFDFTIHILIWYSQYFFINLVFLAIEFYPSVFYFVIKLTLNF